MFEIKRVYKPKTHTVCSVTTPPPRKSCRLWDNAEKCGRTTQVRDDNIIRSMRFAYWITKATETHWEYVTPNSCYSKAPQHYVTLTLPLLLTFKTSGAERDAFFLQMKIQLNLGPTRVPWKRMAFWKQGSQTSVKSVCRHVAILLAAPSHWST